MPVHTVKRENSPVPSHLRHLSYLLDDWIEIPGTRIRVGLDALIGLVPGVGDVVGALISLIIVAEAVRSGVPGFTLARMLLNILLETSVGAIPVVGDVFDAAWKSNARNLRLLEKSLRKRSPELPDRTP